MRRKVAVLIGRENSGKSSLLNYLLSDTVSLVSSQGGMTRDLIRRLWSWNDKTIEIIDTGGFNESDQHYMNAIDMADVILLCHPNDMYIDDQSLHIVRQANKKVILVITKSDKTGVVDPIRYRYPSVRTSSLLSYGRDALAHELFIDDEYQYASNALSSLSTVGILGQPNAGKSTFINTACASSVSLVSPIGGTTTDPVRGYYRDSKYQCYLMDTAGLRKSKTGDTNYMLAQRASLDISNKCDAYVLLIDGTSTHLQTQDKRLVRLLKKRSGVIAITKNDVASPEKIRSVTNDVRALFRDSDIQVISNLRRRAVSSVIASALQKLSYPQIKVSAMQKWLKQMRLHIIPNVKYVSFYKGTLALHGRNLSISPHYLRCALHNFICEFKLQGYYVNICLKDDKNPGQSS